MENNKYKSKLENKIKSGNFVITSEISPPKGTDYIDVLESLKGLKSKVDAINITDQQSSIMRMNALTMSHYIQKEGYESIFQITCRDRNRIALQSDLLGAYGLGIRNILVLTGDHPRFGDHQEAKPVFDLDSVQLLKVISDLEDGVDMVGNELNGKPTFFTGAVVNPGVTPLEPEIIKMEKKVKLGAEFFQTQGTYDVAVIEKFVSKVEHLNIPIIVGIIPLKSVSMANYINKNLAGVNIPEDYIRRLNNSSMVKKESINITVDFINKIKDLVQGVHIMPINWSGAVTKILNQLNNS